MALDGLEAAVVVVLFIAGNEGPDQNTIRRPGDRATTELSSFCVGIIDANDPSLQIAAFSSRGAAYCTDDGNPAIKPEVCAPGVNIRSAIPGGIYEGGWTGSSGPCVYVAGVVALIRQANPDLTATR